eukprot:1703817-Rhodomonas_salina.1
MRYPTQTLSPTKQRTLDMKQLTPPSPDPDEFSRTSDQQRHRRGSLSRRESEASDKLMMRRRVSATSDKTRHKIGRATTDGRERQRSVVG